MRRWFPWPILLILAGPVPAAAEEASAPNVSVQLSEPRPYQQQTVILRLRVSHGPAVAALDVEPLSSGDFILQPLAGPPRTTRRAGPQRMTTDFVYALTPLGSGTLTVPPLRVRVAGNSAAPNPAPAVLQLASEPRVLEVQPLPGDAWVQLPLQALEVTLRVDPRQRLQVGQPFEISIVQQAAGAAGERLPDAAALLEHPDFRIYPGRHRTSSRLTRNGQLLQGQRIDTLTLVPLRDGELRLPSVKLPWWDVTRGREAQAGWPDMRLRVWPAPSGAEAEPVVAQAATAAGMGYLLLAIPGLLLAFIAGWWLRGRYRPLDTSVAGQSSRGGGLRLALRPAFVRAWNRRPLRNHRLSTAGGRFRGPEAVTGRVVANLYRRMASATGRVAAQVPVPLARWRRRARLRKLIVTATDVRQLHRYLLAWGSEALGLPARTTLQELGRSIAQACPQPGCARVPDLLAQLDASLYGNGQPLNLADWKKTLMNELDGMDRPRPRLAVSSSRQQGLPALNPG